MPSSSRGFDDWAVRLYKPVPPVRFRGDVGIAPYANRKPLPFIGSVLNFQVSPPHPSRLRRSTLSKQERAPHPSRLAACHLPRRGRLPPAGGMIPAASSGGVLQYQPFQGFFQVFLVYAGIIDDQAVQVCGLGIKGAEGLDLQALGEECLGQGFVRQARIHFQ